MPSLKVPPSGLSFDSVSAKSTKSASAANQDIIGLTLTDGMIEEMIKCVQNGKPIQLSLGQNPNLSFGNTTQQLSSYQDPFSHELYRSTNSTDNMPNIQPSGKPNLYFQRLLGTGRKPWKPTAAAAAKIEASRLELERNIGSYRPRTLNPIPDPKPSVLPVVNRSKVLASQSRLNDASRSIPSSPALSGIGSPSIAPTSGLASWELAAEKAKALRKPMIHILAQGPISYPSLFQKLQDQGGVDNTALNKVAVKDSNSFYTLTKNYYKELDVWEFDYESDKDREAVIENAIKVYDKFRIPPHDDLWERLKPVEKRGDGVTLSRLQARIANGPLGHSTAPNVDSGRDTPGKNGEDAGNKATSRVKKDTKPRSSSQAPAAAKPKRVTEKEAQAKRIPATKKKPVPAPRKDASNKAGGAKPLSSEFVNSDSEDEASIIKQKPLSAKPQPPPTAKRAREDDGTSDSSLPLSRKARASEEEVERKKKPALVPQPKRAREEESTSDSSLPLSKKARPSDASQSSFASYTAKTTKGTSPQKSSPLASSPPTNASDFGSSSSASSTPRHHPSSHGNGNNIHTHKRNTSSASSATSNGSGLSTHILDLARKYRSYHEVYTSLHQELSALTERERDGDKWEKLMDMHERLAGMKKEIYDATDGM